MRTSLKIGHVVFKVTVQVDTPYPASVAKGKRAFIVLLQGAFLAAFTALFFILMGWVQRWTFGMDNPAAMIGRAALITLLAIGPVWAFWIAKLRNS